MNGRIERDGSLQVLRRGKLQPQWCPFYSGRNLSIQRCGDHCPLFDDYVGVDKKWRVSLLCSPQEDCITIDQDDRDQS